MEYLFIINIYRFPLVIVYSFLYKQLSIFAKIEKIIVKRAITIATINVDINYDITSVLHPNQNLYYRHTDTGYYGHKRRWNYLQFMLLLLLFKHLVKENNISNNIKQQLQFNNTKQII